VALLFGSGVDIWNQSAFDQLDVVFQSQLTFLQALDLQVIRVIGVRQVVNDIVQVPVLQA
jgi:hypothetical protein